MAQAIICEWCGTPIKHDPLGLKAVIGNHHPRPGCPVPAPGPNGTMYAPYSKRIHTDPKDCGVYTCGGCFVASAGS